MPIRKADDRVALNTPWGVISLLNMYGNACYQQLHTHPNSHPPPQAVLSLLFAVVDGIDANSLGFQEHPDGINLLVCNTTQSGAEVAVESDRIEYTSSVVACHRTGGRVEGGGGGGG